MKQSVIITISRECGSGGRAIGAKLAEQMGIPFYDRELIALAAKESGLPAAAFEQLERGMSETAYSLSMLDAHNENDRLFVLQSHTIRELARRGSCVMVGRCADYVLRDFDHVYNIFISANSLQRVERVERKKLFARTRPDGLAARVQMEDRHRRAYYEYYTGRTWGQAANYHLCLDSGKTGPLSADILRCFVESCESMQQDFETRAGATQEKERT